MKSIFYLLSSLLFIAHLYGDGFSAGTKVKTPRGYTSIEILEASDEFISYAKSPSFIEKTIKNNIENWVKIFIDDINILVSQTNFYIA